MSSAVLINGYYVLPVGDLDDAEIDSNAVEISRYLFARGWSKNAIAGMLGNMRAEAQCSPGRIQDDPWPAGYLPSNSEVINSTFSRGMGLVQWTPGRTTLVPFADSLGKLWYDGEAQLLRLIYEKDNNFEFIGTNVNGVFYTWRNFWQSTNDPGDLAEAFLRGYERPDNPDATVANRRYYANQYYGEIKNMLLSVPVLVTILNRKGTDKKCRPM